MLTFITVRGIYNDPGLGVEENNWAVPGELLHEVFEPIINRIIELVQQQIRSCETTPTAVLMVGGFGQSSYLRDRLRRAISSDIEVVQPASGWSAIARGALTQGLADAVPSLATAIKIRARRARAHYGLICSIPFEDSSHDPSHG